MSWVDDLTEEVEEKLTTKWDERNGNVIPDSDSVALKDGVVKVDATFLYADLAGSSKLAQLCPWQTTAKILRAYLGVATRLIRAYGGEIRSFDGDRVMGIFIGDYKNTYSSQCAREIDWCVENIINPKAKEKFDSIKKNNIRITHCVGIDTGEARAVRAGIRDNNDLIWIGKAPSLAAKLSDIRNYPYCVYITKNCYKKLSDDAKMNGSENIWEERIITISNNSEVVYRTKFMKTP